MKQCERVCRNTLVLILALGITSVFSVHTLYADDAINPVIEQFIQNIFLVNADVMMEGSADEASGNGMCRNVGAAFSFGSDGYLVTLDCVVRQASAITVESHEGYQFPAELVGTAPNTRIAVLKTDTSASHTLPSGSLGGHADSGSEVVILCRDKEQVHMHRGTVAKVRPPDGTFVIEAVTHRAVSGAPVFDTDGHFLGLLALQIEKKALEKTSAADSESEEPQSYVVIPAEYVWVVAQSLINSHAGLCGWLGVASDIITPRDVDGVAVRSVVEGSPAEQSGLRADDFIIGFNGDAVPSFRHLIEHLSATDVGETVELTYRRGSETKTVAVTLAPYPSSRN